MARVVAINISDKKGIPKRTIESGMLIENYGLEGDAHAGNWHRQVSLLGKESIDRATTSGEKGLNPGSFAENLTTEGIELYSLPIGTKLQMNEVILEVTQIGKTCHEKCSIYKLVGECVMPKEGVFARVIHGGIIKAGDGILVL